SAETYLRCRTRGDLVAGSPARRATIGGARAAGPRALRQNRLIASYAVNKDAVEHAKQLIDARQYVLRSRWQDVQPRPRTERVLEDALLRGLRALAPGPDRGRRRGDEGALRVRVRRPPAPPPDGPDRLPLPRRRVAAQGDRAGRAQAAAVPGREE